MSSFLYFVPQISICIYGSFDRIIRHVLGPKFAVSFGVAKRPININLLTIRFPVTAIASILHRISGVILFLLIPAFLWIFAISLKSPEGFFVVRRYLTCPLSKLVLLAVLLTLFYHLLAGIRHLFMDAGIGEGLTQARFSAQCIGIVAILVTVLMGIYLW